MLGKVYGVVARRRGRIIAEEMREGQTFFTVSALLPVVESFGFADGSYLVSRFGPMLTVSYRNSQTDFRGSESAINF